MGITWSTKKTSGVFAGGLPLVLPSGLPAQLNNQRPEPTRGTGRQLKNVVQETVRSPLGRIL